ncbi:TonB-dependent siderophore receptor [Ectopseudomonas mendocina]|uniref:TonB-dependent receptor n=1 Tax=Ectopseudomonas mendocina S5.2 TaxID=1225174 RepID=A0ABM5VQL4_ECTME|nr:TonB-dependent siderophore receptor [Pseudomonas mendocina]ALN17122.1 TonB-dependent receptor [Pseudomonas mendocina S5.2]KES02068.1 TonB-dependent receptor [Pseudomonas mendocina]
MFSRRTHLAVAIAAACSFNHAVASEQEQLELDAQTVVGDSVAAEVDSYKSSPSSAATKLDLTPRQTPQSISTVNSAQIDDFQLNTINDVLKFTPGITVEEIETDRTYYTARGFDITNFQFDGVGVPFSSGGQEGAVDLAPFERVEVLRGANGLMSGTGNPSATVNFVRKRPTSAPQARVDLTAGSWDKRRVEADVSGALTNSGNVRGRAVYAHDSKNSYLDRYSREKHVFYGVVEADLRDDTLLSIGYTLDKSAANSPLWGALPLFDSVGNPTRLSRSTSTAADWSWWNNQEQRIFSELTHTLANGWQVKGSVTHVKKTSDSELFYVFGTPDATTGQGLFGYPSQYSGDIRQWIGDISLGGPFSLAGREHELVLGANWYKSDVEELSLYIPGRFLPVPTEDIYNGDFPKPAWGLSDGGSYEDKQKSFYSAARFNLTDDLTFIAGARSIELKTEGFSYGQDRKRKNNAFLPYAGLVYDLTDQYSVYASYTEIFNPQKEEGGDLRRLDPIMGENYELGIKGELLDGKLNVSAAVFKTKQSNVAESIGFDTGSGKQIYGGVDYLSEGYELEVSGEILPGLQVMGGYTYVDIQNADHSHGRTYAPKHMFRVSTVYRVPQLPQLKVGANLSWQDDVYRSVTLPDGSGARIEQDDYALVGLMASYDVDPNWSVSANLNNLTNEKYISSLYWEQGFYGAPRNVSATLTWKY